MRHRVGMHRANQAHLVNDLTDVREKFAYLNPAFTVRLELEGRSKSTASHIFRLGTSPGKWLSVVLLQKRLGIERVHLRQTAVEENVNHMLGLRSVMRQVTLSRVRRCLSLQQAPQPESTETPNRHAATIDGDRVEKDSSSHPVVPLSPQT